MADMISIKRPRHAISPLYNEPESDECFEHCVTLNGDELTKLGAPMPEKGDVVHFSAMATVVGFGDDHGRRYVRLEITDVLFAENETEESEEGEEEAEGEK